MYNHRHNHNLLLGKGIHLRILRRFLAHCLHSTKKQSLLVHLLRKHKAKRTLVFARTKHRANRIAKFLKRDRISAEAIHSDKAQGARQRALANFAKGSVKVLVATDIVSRGIDVDDISYVINFDLPDDPENHVHRIGRTARAGATGTAFSFCDPEENFKLRSIEKFIQFEIDKEPDHEFHSEESQSKYESAAKQRGRKPKSKSGSKKRPRKKNSGHSRGKPNVSDRRPAKGPGAPKSKKASRKASGKKATSKQRTSDSTSKSTNKRRPKKKRNKSNAWRSSKGSAKGRAAKK